MKSNEETLHIQVSSKKEEKVTPPKNNMWKKVTFGTTAGILLGAGSLYAMNNLGNEVNKDENQDGHNDHDSHGNNGGDAHHANSGGDPNATIYENAPIAEVNDNMSFSDAFASARAQVGPGGVFSWHGGIYGTYYENEWNAMSDAQRSAYAQSVHPEVRPEHVDVTNVNQSHPDVDVPHDAPREPDPNFRQTSRLVDEPEPEDPDDPFVSDDEYVVGRGEADGHRAVAIDVDGDDEADLAIIDVDDSNSVTDPDVIVYSDGTAQTLEDYKEGLEPTDLEDVYPDLVSEDEPEEPFGDDDVRVIDQGEVDGHLAAALDVDGDLDPDMVIIDADDSISVTDPDIIVYSDGTSQTVEEYTEANAPAEMEVVNPSLASMEEPDVSPDMPDYMDDAAITI